MARQVTDRSPGDGNARPGYRDPVSAPSPAHRVPRHLLAWISDHADELEREATGHVVRIGIGADALEAGRGLGSNDVDSVVSVAALAGAVEPEAVLAAIAAALGEDGRLLFLEPELGFGNIARMAARLPWKPLFGLSGEVGVPWAIRRAGLQVVTVRRLTAPTRIPAYRHWVMGTAILPVPVPSPTNGELRNGELQTSETEAR
jgi:hypothetical protein